MRQRQRSPMAGGPLSSSGGALLSRDDVTVAGAAATAAAAAAPLLPLGSPALGRPPVHRRLDSKGSMETLLGGDGGGGAAGGGGGGDDHHDDRAGLGAHICLMAAAVLAAWAIDLAAIDLAVRSAEGLMAAAVLAAWAIDLAVRSAEGRVAWLARHRIISGFRLFKLSMCTALALMCALRRATPLVFRSEWFFRLSGLCLDLMAVAAIGTIAPRALPPGTAGPFAAVVAACCAWNVAAFLALAPRMFPNHWVSRGGALTADTLGHAWVGLLTVRAIDPGLRTPVPLAYAYKTMLFFVPDSGGKNALAVAATDALGVRGALAVCAAGLAFWAWVFRAKVLPRMPHFQLRERRRKRQAQRDRDARSSLGGGGGGGGLSSGDDDNGESELVRLTSSADVAIDGGGGGGDFDAMGGGGGAAAFPAAAQARQRAVAAAADAERGVVDGGGDLLPGDAPDPVLSEQSDILKAAHVRRLAVEGLAHPYLAKLLQLRRHSNILKAARVRRLAGVLPPAERTRNWQLLYSTARDGASCATLLWRCSRTPHTSLLFVIEDTWGYIFGGFAEVSLHDSHSYKECGTSFVFSFHPNGFQRWTWSGANPYVLLTNDTCIAMGGGDGGFAFRLDDELDQRFDRLMIVIHLLLHSSASSSRDRRWEAAARKGKGGWNMCLVADLVRWDGLHQLSLIIQPRGGGGDGSSGGSSTSSGGGSTGAPPMRLFALSGNAAAPDAHQLYQEARQRHRASSVSAAPPAPPAQQFHASPPSDGSAAPPSSSGGGSSGSSSSAWGYMATRSARQADVHHAARVARLSETASRPPPPAASGSPAHSAASSGGGAAAAQEDARGRSRSVRRWGLSSRGRRKRADAATAAAAGAADAAAAVATAAAAGAEAVGAGMKSVSSARAASSSLAAAAVAAAAALGPRTPSRLRRGRAADAELQLARMRCAAAQNKPRQRVEAGVTISRSRSRGRTARSSEQAIERSLSVARGCCAPLLPLSVSPVPPTLRSGASALPPLQPPLLLPLPPIATAAAAQEAPPAPPHLAYAPHYSSATSDFEFLGRWSPSKRHRGSSGSGGSSGDDDAWSGGASRRLRRAAAAALDGGGFSQLWLARDRATGKSYLAKVFDVARLAGAGATCATKVLTTIAAERRVLEGLWCPYLASSLATLRDESHLYMVTNVAPSDDLGTRLARDGRLDGAAAAFAFAQIVEAVAHMHARGIAHRALAPEAVVVDAEGHVKLTNFGSAKAHVHSATSGCRTVCGRDPYSAPEVWFGVTPYGLAADWWSAGVLLHALLTGKVPVPIVMLLDPDEKVPVPTVMLPDLDEEVSACLAAAPAYVSAAAADCVQRLLQGDPARRLGGGAAGATAVKAHPLFAHIDWPTLARRGYNSPLAPRPPRPAPHANLPFRSQPLALAPIKTAVANFSAPPQAAQSPQSWGRLFNLPWRATSKSPTE
ncbi:hypothetical protein JKP88DRAFT_347634 [Tribonema minus]|uniref:Protein kinase domain-containing protein n=1 Tax=Tribonema minus TaxID=303371 RepID=A0A835ZE27_9STRA|nr:hypothetical protein JKP88DRAFT_347634 [Tribonema minus]